MKQVTITYIDGASETLNDVEMFNFFGSMIVYDMKGGREYEVRNLALMKRYEVKEVPYVNPMKALKKKKK